eukprot:9477260-Karenia_brevis.AAC.1
MDAADTALRAKMRKYRSLIPELSAAGITFRPMVWTADCQPHAAVLRTLAFAADIASRKHGGVSKA